MLTCIYSVQKDDKGSCLISTNMQTQEKVIIVLQTASTHCAHHKFTALLKAVYHPEHCSDRIGLLSRNLIKITFSLWFG